MSHRLRQLQMEADEGEKYDRRDLEDNSVKMKRMREIKLLEEKLKYLNTHFYEMELEAMPSPPVEWRSLRVSNKEQS